MQPNENTSNYETTRPISVHGTNTVLVEKDAKDRAVRTFIQGLITDAGFALGGILLTAADQIEWTENYWKGLAVLAGKTVILTALSYVGRKLKPPVGAAR
jgi:hypothetical protein